MDQQSMKMAGAAAIGAAQPFVMNAIAGSQDQVLIPNLPYKFGNMLSLINNVTGLAALGVALYGHQIAKRGLLANKDIQHILLMYGAADLTVNNLMNIVTASPASITAVTAKLNAAGQVTMNPGVFYRNQGPVPQIMTAGKQKAY